MKKKIVALLAGALMTIAASNAFAFVATDLELYRVVYDATTKTTYEQISDLGNFSTLKSLTATTVVGNAYKTAAFDAAAATAGSNLKIAYFAFDVANKQVYLSQTNETAIPKINALKWASAGAGLVTSVNTDGALAGGLGSNTNVNGFFKKEGVNFGSFFTAGSTTANLSNVSLATMVNNAETHIYKFDNANASVFGTQFLTLTTDKTTGLSSVKAVPIPPAFFLMGSGLLGMVGLRRKRK
ncbi:MAG: hypothetical protein FD174_1630 [Geobacteraceae bacterium]|nr:MAG: hypothetical protein FD174_1630 [Geobacteraceae bacterium]